MIAASILDIKEPKLLEVEKLSKLDIDYIHADVMDEIFVQNKTMDFFQYSNILKSSQKDLDVHLMVSDVKKYIDEYSKLTPKFITFHYEAVSDVMSVINYIRKLNIGVGISIKPSTEVEEIIKYLKYIDLVLIMSVEPGKGGQCFMDNSIEKIEKLYKLREKENYTYLIEIDGGINDQTIKKCKNADICVVGSFITNNDYEEAIKKLKNS